MREGWSKKLTKEELEKLKGMWTSCSKEDIIKAFPNRNYGALSNRMYQLGIKCEIERGRKGDVSKLLEETEEAYYWLGFIAADGHISTQNQVVVMISERDKEHLQKLADFLKTEVKYPYKKDLDRSGFQATEPLIRITVCDSVLVPKIKEKLGITKTNKTYNPIKLSAIPDEFKMAFIIGFIDGDGSIYETNGMFCLKIQNHKNWFNFLVEILDFLYKEEHSRKPSVRLEFKKDKDHYATLAMAKYKILRNLYSKAKELPSLDRKWNKIKNI